MLLAVLLVVYYIIFILAALNACLTLASLPLAFELKGIIVIVRLYFKNSWQFTGKCVTYWSGKQQTTDFYFLGVIMWNNTLINGAYLYLKVTGTHCIKSAFCVLWIQIIASKTMQKKYENTGTESASQQYALFSIQFTTTTLMQR